MRRGFYDLARGGAAPIAVEALKSIAELYAIEAETRERPAAERQAVQAERSRPLVEALFAWLGAQFARLPGSSPTAVAMRYTSEHRNGLVRFRHDGRIEADTNAVNEERSASREPPLAGPVIWDEPPSSTQHSDHTALRQARPHILLDHLHRSHRHLLPPIVSPEPNLHDAHGHITYFAT